MNDSASLPRIDMHDRNGDLTGSFSGFDLLRWIDDHAEDVDYEDIFLPSRMPGVGDDEIDLEDEE